MEALGDATRGGESRRATGDATRLRVLSQQGKPPVVEFVVRLRLHRARTRPRAESAKERELASPGRSAKRNKCARDVGMGRSRLFRRRLSDAFAPGRCLATRVVPERTRANRAARRFKPRVRGRRARTASAGRAATQCARVEVHAVCFPASSRRFALACAVGSASRRIDGLRTQTFKGTSNPRRLIPLGRENLSNLGRNPARSQPFPSSTPFATSRARSRGGSSAQALLQSRARAISPTFRVSSRHGARRE